MGARLFCTGEQESAPYWRQSLPNLFVSRIRMGNLLCCSGILTSLPPETHEAEPPASSRSSYSFEKRLWALLGRSSAKGTRIPCVTPVATIWLTGGPTYAPCRTTSAIEIRATPCTTRVCPADGSKGSGSNVALGRLRDSHQTRCTLLSCQLVAQSGHRLVCPAMSAFRVKQTFC